MFRTVNNAKRLLCQILKNKGNVRGFRTSRIAQSSDGHWVYRRNAFPPPPYVERLTTIAGTLMWYWVIYHLLTQYEHITGEFEYPVPSKWTDQELGIPSDDEE